MGKLRRFPLGSLAAVALSLALPTAAAQGAPGAQLSATPQIVQAGGSLSAALQPAGPPRLAFFLSRDRRRSDDDLALGPKRLVTAGGSATTKLEVPRRTSPLAAYLLACAPRRGGPCASSAQRLAVIRPPSPARARPVPGGSPVTATVGASGGAVAASSKAGAMTLTVPGGALIKDTDLTLTPLAKIGGGLPGHLTGAAATGPDGVALSRLAQLALPGASSAGIAFSTGGANLHLTPVAHGKISISALGGGGGAIEAPKAKLAAFARRHVAADPISQLEQLAAVGAAPLGGHRHPGAAASAAGGDQGAGEINAYLTAGALQVEAISQADFLLGVSDFQRWDTVAQALSGNEISILPALEAQVKATLTASGLRQVTDDEQRCDGGDLSRRPHMLELEASANSVGIGALSDAVRGAVARCFQFDLLIDSDIEFHAEGSGLQGGWHWHYQAKVPLDYESPVPSATHFNAQGSNEGKFVTAEGAETEVEPGGCSEDGSTIEGIAELVDGDGGAVDATGDFTVPLVPGEAPRVSVEFSSSAIETYDYEVKDETNPKCNGGFEREQRLWWLGTWISLVSDGGTSQSPEDPVSLTLEPPDPQKAPDAGLVGERSIPAGADGFGGTTTIKVIHDPGHILLPGLPPA